MPFKTPNIDKIVFDLFRDGQAHSSKEIAIVLKEQYNLTDEQFNEKDRTGNNDLRHRIDGTIYRLKRKEKIECIVNGVHKLRKQEDFIPCIAKTEDQIEVTLEKSWHTTSYGKKYDLISRQYKTETGVIDILAKSKDNSHYLVVEIKKNNPSDKVVGQILRYMGDIEQTLCNKNQTVRGVIIAESDDVKMQRALFPLKDTRVRITLNTHTMNIAIKGELP